MNFILCWEKIVIALTRDEQQHHVRKARAPMCEKQQHWCARNNTNVMQDEQYLAPHKMNSNITG
jgi:hypothetical protein